MWNIHFAVNKKTGVMHDSAADAWSNKLYATSLHQKKTTKINEGKNYIKK